MNELLGKILVLKCRINEVVIGEIAYAQKVKPEEVTVEHLENNVSLTFKMNLFL